MRSTIGRLRFAVAMVLTVLALGTTGFYMFGLSFIDAMYMTLITITTVGYHDIFDSDPVISDTQKMFTMVIIVMGVGTMLYTLTLGVQVVVEGQLRDFVGRRRMDKKIADMEGHVIVCGWGRVGKAVARDIIHDGTKVVVIDVNAARVADIDVPTVIGDATLDAVLLEAGVGRASALVAALDGDAENLFVSMSSRALNPDLFIVARARQEASIDKLTRAGADRVVNPQELGAARMSSFVVQPNVAEFVDVVMHERSMDFRMQEVDIPENSRLAGSTLRDANLRQQADVLVLAIRGTDGEFVTNPDPDTRIEIHTVIIAVGTEDALEKLVRVCA